MRVKKLYPSYFITIFLVSTFSSELIGQIFEYGDIPVTHLEMEVYDKDSSANAVVLFDKGSSEIRYLNNRGFRLFYSRHKRIKVLQDAGVEVANVEISFRHEEPEQEIKKIKATAYNISSDGSISSQSIEKSDIFTEQVSRNWSDLKFSIPGVKKGTVIEISYEMEMDFLLWYPDWYFQSEIPTIWSEYTTRIPEYFVFAYQTQGYEQLSIEESKSYSSRMGSEFQSGKELFFVMKDIQGLPDEPFIRSREAYEARIEFQFTKVQIPAGRTYFYSQPWDKLIEDLLDDRNFGKRIKSHDDLKGTAQLYTYGVDSDIEKMKLLYNHVAEAMEWDGYYGIFLEKNVVNHYKDGRASGSQINMVLLQMLLDVGIKAHPMLVSTHNHGEVNTLLGVVDQFNHALIYVDLGDEAFILDATDEHRPFNLLPENVIGGTGLLVYKDQVIWMPVENIAQNITVKTLLLNLTEGGYQGNLRAQNLGYYARNIRKEYNESDSLKAFQDLLFGADSFTKITSVTEIADELGNGFNYQIEFSNEDGVDGDIMYFNPMIVDQLLENPFQIEDRFFPVDFGFTFQKMTTMNINLPQGWAIDEMPKPIIYRLPDNGAEFQRILQAGAGSVMMRYILKVNKPQFTPEEYAALKALYDQLVTTHSENIVLKKEG